MENLFFEATGTTPLVDFKSDGRLKIEGKALPEDSRKFFNPLFEWVGNFEGDEIIMDINLYYFNTAISKQLHEFFKMVDTNPQYKKITVNWHYEEGDEEALESGEMYENFMKNSDFNYIEYAEQF